MKKNKRRGSLCMIAGLLLLASSMALTLYNVGEQHAADASSLTVLSQLKGEIPTASQSAQPLVLTDTQGNAVEWPMDEKGEPMPWPVDESGDPEPIVRDGAGREFLWQEVAHGVQADAAPALADASLVTDWTSDAEGNLLPWIMDDAGQTIAWPTDGEGEALSWEEIQEKWKQIVLKLLPYQAYAAAQPDFVRYPDMEMPTEEIDGHDYIGVLEIPSLELSLPVMSEWSNEKFKMAPCRYVGSVYSEDIVIAAHNYQRHFGKLKTLREGDEVCFTDVEGNVFIYAVSGFDTLGKKDVEEMTTGEWDMTLFTCTPGGAKRVTVRCTLERYIVSSENQKMDEK